MNTSAQQVIERMIGSFPSSSTWGRTFRDLCLGIIGCVVLAALGLMLRISPQAQSLTYTALAAVLACALIYQVWRLWPLDTQFPRVFIPVLTVAAVLGATSGLHAVTVLAVLTLCLLPSTPEWGRGPQTAAALPPLMMATVQTLSLSGPTPLLLLSLALPLIIWWPAAQRVMTRLPVRTWNLVCAVLTLLTLCILTVRLIQL